MEHWQQIITAQWRTGIKISFRPPRKVTKGLAVSLGGSDVHRSDVLGQPRRVVLGKSRRDVPSGGHVEMLWRQQTCRIKTNMASDQCVIVCFAASAAERFPRAAWYLIPSLISHLHWFFDDVAIVQIAGHQVCRCMKRSWAGLAQHYVSCFWVKILTNRAGIVATSRALPQRHPPLELLR